MKQILFVVVVATLALWAGMAQGAPGADEKCQAGRNQAVGKYALCRQRAEAKLIKTAGVCSVTPDQPPCYRDENCPAGETCVKDLTRYGEALGKCSERFTETWSKMSTKYGGPHCVFPGYGDPMNDFVTAHSATIAASLEYDGPYPAIAPPLRTGQTHCDQGAGTLGPCPGSPAGQDGALLKGVERQYVDNFNGTITDKKTGLMWEKLDDNNANGIHDYSATFTWNDAFKKIQVLNGDATGCIAANNPDACCTGSGTGTCSPFAGYTDWRLPNVNELQSLADYGLLRKLDPAIDGAFNKGCVPPCLVAKCSCTQSSLYWSATTNAGSPASAWGVDFVDGGVGDTGKTIVNYARAVRDGL